MKADTWMPLYVADYRKDTARLTCEQHGAYLLLIMDYWVGGPLPDDDVSLAQIARLEVRQWRKHRPALKRFFQIGRGVWRHKRIEEERSKAERMAEARRVNGAKGGRPRKLTETEEEPDTKPAGNREDNLRQTGDETPARVALPSPSHLPSEGSEANASAQIEVIGDPDATTWRMARLLIAERCDLSPEAAGRFFGGLLKEHGLEARDMFGAVAEATANGTLDVKGFLAGAAAHRAKKRAGPQLTAAEKALRSNII